MFSCLPAGRLFQVSSFLLINLQSFPVLFHIFHPIVDVSFFHPQIGEAIHQRANQPVPQAELCLSGYSRKVPYRYLDDSTLLEQNHRRQKSVKTFEHRNAFRYVSSNDFQRATGVIHTVLGKRSPNAVGNERRHVFDKRVFAVGTHAGHQFVVISVGEQAIEIFRRSLVTNS